MYEILNQNRGISVDRYDAHQRRKLAKKSKLRALQRRALIG